MQATVCATRGLHACRELEPVDQIGEWHTVDTGFDSVTSHDR